MQLKWKLLITSIVLGSIPYSGVKLIQLNPEIRNYLENNISDNIVEKIRNKWGIKNEDLLERKRLLDRKEQMDQPISMIFQTPSLKYHRIEHISPYTLVDPISMKILPVTDKIYHTLRKEEDPSIVSIDTFKDIRRDQRSGAIKVHTVTFMDTPYIPPKYTLEGSKVYDRVKEFEDDLLFEVDTSKESYHILKESCIWSYWDAVSDIQPIIMDDTRNEQKVERFNKEELNEMIRKLEEERKDIKKNMLSYLETKSIDEIEEELKRLDHEIYSYKKQKRKL